MPKPKIFISNPDSLDPVWFRRFRSTLENQKYSILVEGPDVLTKSTKEQNLRNSDTVIVVLDQETASQPDTYFKYGFAIATRKHFLAMASMEVEIGNVPRDLQRRIIRQAISPEESAYAIASILNPTTKATETKPERDLTSSQNQREYEVVFILDPTLDQPAIVSIMASLRDVVTGCGGHLTKSEIMGSRELAYEIMHHKSGTFVLFEITGSGREIAELERRLRINDSVLRYITVRVDEDRRRAEILKKRRTRRQEQKKAAAQGSAWHNRDTVKLLLADLPRKS